MGSDDICRWRTRCMWGPLPAQREQDRDGRHVPGRVEPDDHVADERHEEPEDAPEPAIELKHRTRDPLPGRSSATRGAYRDCATTSDHRDRSTSYVVRV